MKKFMMLILSLAFLGSFATPLVSTTDNFLVGTVYAQEEAPAPAPVEPAPAVEVEDREVSIPVAADMVDHTLEIPAWVSSVLMFVQGIPKVGPVLSQIISYAGMAAVALTFLASILMGVSGMLGIFTKKEESPKILKDAKKYVDYAIEVAKYLSMYNKK